MPRSLTQLQADIQAIWQAGVAAVDSRQLIFDQVSVQDQRLVLADHEIDLSTIDRILVIGGGKAAAAMAGALEEVLGEQLLTEKKVMGLLSVPEDCLIPLKQIKLIAGRPAGINAPREAGVAATRQMLEFVAQLSKKDLCICLLAGGGSALLPAPEDGISLTEKQQITAFLSESGANIAQLNTVRKQLSKIKGGGLAQAASKTNLVSLIISDVLGDPLDVIASGPTVANSTTAADALKVLEEFNASQDSRFQNIFQFLNNQVASPKFDHSFDHVANIVLGNNAVSVDAAGVEAEKRGYSHAMLSAQSLEGPAEQVGIHLAEMALKMSQQPGPDCLITGGEPTVNLAEANIRGKGGRNQQVVLAALNHLVDLIKARPELLEQANFAILSGGTDGEDGPTDAAGAWLDRSTIKSVIDNRLNVQDYLNRNDAYHFFEPLNRLIKTGPTQTNVCDLRVVVVSRVQRQ